MFYLVGIFRTSSLGGNISSGPVRTALRSSEGAWLNRSFTTKGRESEHQMIVAN